MRTLQVSSAKRKLLVRLIRYCAAFFVIAIVYTLFDFAIDIRPPGIQDSYQFNLRDLAGDQVRILRRDNLAILIIKRSDETINQLRHYPNNLQDLGSAHSSQPEFARNPLRSSHPGYFVSYAIGTDLGCPLAAVGRELGEVCGKARYDFAGRALKGEKEFQNLAIPDYNFTNDFSTLTIRP